MSRSARIAGWIALAGAIFLGARGLAYLTLGPRTVASAALADEGGGPPVAIIAVALPLVALALASALASLTRLGVAERHRLSGEGAATAPGPMRVRTIALRSLALTAGSSVLFAGIESYLHWRAGLGFHGIHCLLGPVHRDALPFLVALSVLAAAGSVALGHALAWLRRAAPAAGRPPARALRAALTLAVPSPRSRAQRRRAPGGSRAPPLRGASNIPSH